ncbi:MAG TPA: dTMP kinase [Candidatus Binatia bacterium]|nr:dTMP kinase [Candidatus Binatia bacterium]
MVRFITFEGGDGTGKTTQIRSLESHLKKIGRSCVVTREPGGTALGGLIRKVLLEVGDHEVAPETELLLYLADRAQHVNEVIMPAIQAGNIVLCDRFTDSTVAYQGYARGMDLRLLQQLNDFADRGFRPDLTYLLDCPVSVALSRTARRQSAIGQSREDRFEREKLEFHEKVRAGFLKLAEAEPERFRIIDALRPAEETAAEIRDIIDQELR